MTHSARQMTLDVISSYRNVLKSLTIYIGMSFAYHNNMIDFKTAKRIIIERHKVDAASANEIASDLLRHCERLGYRIRNENDFVEMLNDLERLGS